MTPFTRAKDLAELVESLGFGITPGYGEGLWIADRVAPRGGLELICDEAECLTLHITLGAAAPFWLMIPPGVPLPFASQILRSAMELVGWDRGPGPC